jgi:hypothetical protein
MAVWVVWALVTRPSAGWEVGDSVAVRCPLGERPWAPFAFPRRGRAHLSARSGSSRSASPRRLEDGGRLRAGRHFQTESKSGEVERTGIEPVTSGLQSRCSPS